MSLGAKPKLQWIAPKALSIDMSYQREVSSKRGQALIEKLAAGWSWIHCSALIVAPAKARGHFVIIDGQHRHQAAIARGDIDALPCLVVDAKEVADQAKAFIAHNRDRVTLNFLALFHADVAAGNETALMVVNICNDVGVTIRRSPCTTAQMPAAETMAIGAMQMVARQDNGKALLTDTLSVLQAAYPARNGQLRSDMVKAVATVLSLGVPHAKVIAALENTDADALDRKARDTRGGGAEPHPGVHRSARQGLRGHHLNAAGREGPESAARQAVHLRSLEGEAIEAGAGRDPWRREGAAFRDGRERSVHRRLHAQVRLRGRAQPRQQRLPRQGDRQQRPPARHVARRVHRIPQRIAQEARPRAGHAERSMRAAMGTVDSWSVGPGTGATPLALPAPSRACPRAGAP